MEEEEYLVKFERCYNQVADYDEEIENNDELNEDLFFLKTDLDNLQDQNVELETEVKSLKESINYIQQEKLILSKKNSNCKLTIDEFKSDCLQLAEKNNEHFEKIIRQLEYELIEKNETIKKLVKKLNDYRAQDICRSSRSSCLHDVLKSTKCLQQENEVLKSDLSNLRILNKLNPLKSKENVHKYRESNSKISTDILRAKKVIKMNRFKLEENLDKLKSGLLQGKKTIDNVTEIQSIQKPYHHLFETKYRYVVFIIVVLAFNLISTKFVSNLLNMKSREIFPQIF